MDLIWISTNIPVSFTIPDRPIDPDGIHVIEFFNSGGRKRYQTSEKRAWKNKQTSKCRNFACFETNLSPKWMWESFLFMQYTIRRYFYWAKERKEPNESRAIWHFDTLRSSKKRTSLNVITKEWHATVNNKQSQSGRALCVKMMMINTEKWKKEGSSSVCASTGSRESDVSTTKFFAYLIILLLLGVLLCVFIHSRHFIYSSMRNLTDRMLKGSLILLSSLRLLAHSS